MSSRADVLVPHTVATWRSFIAFGEILECPICRDILHDACWFDPCGHAFCRECLTRHLQENAWCPVCRAVHTGRRPLSEIRSFGTVDDLAAQLRTLMASEQMSALQKLIDPLMHPPASSGGPPDEAPQEEEANNNGGDAMMVDQENEEEEPPHLDTEMRQRAIDSVTDEDVGQAMDVERDNGEGQHHQWAELPPFPCQDGDQQHECPASEAYQPRAIDEQSNASSEEPACVVCDGTETSEGDVMVFCDGDNCKTVVHQQCYGIAAVPEGKWYCNACVRRRAEQGVDGMDSDEEPLRKRKPRTRRDELTCVLCGRSDPQGFKPTDDGRWVHLRCALWTPETVVLDTDRQEPVSGLGSIAKGRWRLRCCICGVKGGAPIQCANRGCAVAFHAFCHKKAGLRMELKDCGDSVLRRAWCPHHSQISPSPTGSCHSPTSAPGPASTRQPHVDRNGPMRASDGAADRRHGTSSGGASSSGGEGGGRVWRGRPRGEVVLLGSSLSNQQQSVLDRFADRSGCRVVPSYSPEVTHLIVRSKECRRTVKFLKALLTGKWILAFDWVSRCLSGNRWLSEDGYEVSKDMTTGAPIPPRRQRTHDTMGRLFGGLRFYFLGTFTDPLPTASEVKDLLELGGGCVVTTSPQSLTRATPLPHPSQWDEAGGGDSPDGGQGQQLMVVVAGDAHDPHRPNVSFRWVCDCVSHGKLQPPTR
ncbi:unnamed protein product [Vitrella brassicaformis CCMP3155]|uniref:RING-type E3 ubiquitin transferase BRCA1 n=1 Tax=Vitrella brassicaformis (strain CCMP3155) TaxID=1169540 RepID=A0A0G4FP14_VITBC|nr:unnamed protein product [Vitrella brassicaformis CCMP3155]|eukprot:CEM15557.1 unnamed protein product [Vitrella brassicaformis CCMP3155]